jgi:exosome complex component RRP40
VFYPKIDDIVIGRVVSKSGENFILDINSPTLAILNSIEFRGASKKNKPKIEVGDLVFARVMRNVDKFYKPLLTCIKEDDMKDFNSGEAYFG